MSLYIPTWEERCAAKEERAEIIDVIMNIKNPETLKMIKAVANALVTKEYAEYPLTLDEFVDYLDLPMAVKLMDLFKNEKSGITANDQINELLSRYISQYMGPEGGAVYGG